MSTNLSMITPRSFTSAGALTELVAALQTPQGARAARKASRIAVRAANTIGRAFKRSRINTSFSTMSMGGSTSYSRRAKPSVKESGDTYSHHWDSTLDTRYLYSQEIRFPAVSDVSNVNRHPDLIHLSGIKTCYNFVNQTNIPVEVHFAICQSKAKLLSGQQDLTEDFFRDNSGNSQDHLNFDFTTDWDIRYQCNAINPDKWNIITHTKRILWPKSSDTATGQGQYFWRHEKYYNLQKRIRFDNISTVLNTEPFIVLVWCVELLQGDAPSEAPTASAVSLHGVNSPYWKNALYQKLGIRF